MPGVANDMFGMACEHGRDRAECSDCAAERVMRVGKDNEMLKRLRGLQADVAAAEVPTTAAIQAARNKRLLEEAKALGPRVDAMFEPPVDVNSAVLSLLDRVAALEKRLEKYESTQGSAPADPEQP